NNNRRYFTIAAIAALLLSVLWLQAATATDIDETDKYAWSENGGWQNFNSTHSVVSVYNDHLEGFAWAETIGWIKLGSYSGGSPHTYANMDETDWGVNNDGSGNLSGFAWSENAGWINFNSSHSQVTIAANGDFEGFAWSETVGWIHFQNADPTYKVKVDFPDINFNPTGGTTIEGQQITLTIQSAEAFTGSVDVALDIGQVTDFNPAYTTQTIDFDNSDSEDLLLNTMDDSIVEGTESFEFTLQNPVGADLGPDTTFTLYVNDDDIEITPGFSVDNVAAIVNESGIRSFAEFTVSLSALCGDTVRVSFATEDNTAQEDIDYVGTSGELEFTPADRTVITQTIQVEIIATSLDEQALTFHLNLFDVENGEIIDSQGTATLVDDNLNPMLIIDDVTLDEGDVGPVQAQFTVTLVGAADNDVTVDYQTIDATALAGVDYESISDSLTFPANSRESSQTITVNILPDETYQPDKFFFIDLSNASNAAIVDARGIGLILNDDPRPGDIDANGALNSDDVADIVNFILTGDNLDPDQIDRCDANGDGNVNILDIFKLIDLILSGCFD
ncbi:MAG: hypothetical protein GY869_22750, partial [Planctomycetes bacterium]|nr:hypothetical protein [Planctomycetota bacterium]